MKTGETSATTYVFSGGKWSRMSTAGRTPNTPTGQMVYDPANKLDLYWDQHSMWVFDGTSWTHVKPAIEPGVDDAQLAYDPATGGVVMLGNNNSVWSTWSWNGSSWTRLDPGHPAPFSLVWDLNCEACVATDAAAGTVVTIASNGYQTEVWELARNGREWSQIATLPFLLADVVADPADGSIIGLTDDNRVYRWSPSGS